jgi:hypothetical protein
MNRSRLDAEGERKSPNTSMSAGFRTFGAFSLAAVLGAGSLISLFGER